MKQFTIGAVISCMKKTALLMITALIAALPSYGKGPNIQEIGASSQQVGDSGVAWYTTWKTALAEAKRSKRPVFFMSAAAQCSGISGVF